MTTDATPTALRLIDQVGPRLVACPMCGAGKGYSLSDGSTHRWWRVTCADCGRFVDECRSDDRMRLGGILPDRCESADRAWNEAGAYGDRLRTAAQYAAHQLEQARVWNGTDWHWNMLHPLHYRSALERLRDVLRA